MLSDVIEIERESKGVAGVSGINIGKYPRKGQNRYFLGQILVNFREFSLVASGTK